MNELQKINVKFKNEDGEYFEEEFSNIYEFVRFYNGFISQQLELKIIKLKINEKFN